MRFPVKILFFEFLLNNIDFFGFKIPSDSLKFPIFLSIAYLFICSRFIVVSFINFTKKIKNEGSFRWFFRKCFLKLSRSVADVELSKFRPS